MTVNIATQGGILYDNSESPTFVGRIELTANLGRFASSTLIPTGTRFSSLHLALAYQPTFYSETLTHRLFTAVGYTSNWQFTGPTDSHPSATVRLGLNFDPEQRSHIALSLEGMGNLFVGGFFFITGTVGIHFALDSGQTGLLLLAGAGTRIF